MIEVRFSNYNFYYCVFALFQLNSALLPMVSKMLIDDGVQYLSRYDIMILHRLKRVSEKQFDAIRTVSLKYFIDLKNMDWSNRMVPIYEKETGIFLGMRKIIIVGHRKKTAFKWHSVFRHAFQTLQKDGRFNNDLFKKLLEYESYDMPNIAEMIPNYVMCLTRMRNMKLITFRSACNCNFQNCEEMTIYTMIDLPELPTVNYEMIDNVMDDTSFINMIFEVCPDVDFKTIDLMIEKCTRKSRIKTAARQSYRRIMKKKHAEMVSNMVNSNVSIRSCPAA